MKLFFIAIAIFLSQAIVRADPIVNLPPPIFDGDIPEIEYQIGNGSVFYDINDTTGERRWTVSGIVRITASDTQTDVLVGHLILSNGEPLTLNGIVDSTFPPLNPTFSSLFASVPSIGDGTYRVSWRPFGGEFESIHYSFFDDSDFFLFSDADFPNGRRYGLELNGTLNPPPIETTPEPASALLLALGLFAARCAKRRASATLKT